MIRPGKLDPELLADLIGSVDINDDRVVIRAGIGRDVCAIRTGDHYLVATTDPVTFATDRIGWYAVHVNANDLATVGAQPKWFLCTALLPENRTDEALVRTIWKDTQDALQRIGCCLVGGHTEVTVGIDRPILVGQMLGEVAVEDLVDKSDIRPGDRVLVTKGVPIEGTAIMAIEKPQLLEDRFDAETLQQACGFLDDPGISVLPEAMIACAVGGIHGMHDPTEGGIATGLWEIAQAGKVGLRIDAEAIPLLEPGASFCRHLGIDPLGTLSSGALILCVSPESVVEVLSALHLAGIDCTDIGEVVPAAEGVRMVRQGQLTDVTAFASDEITRIL